MKKPLLFLFLCLFFNLLSFAQTSVKYRAEKAVPAPAIGIDSVGNFDHFGGKVSIGITILDGFGLPVRFYLNQNHVLEVGAYLGGEVVQSEPNIELVSGLMLGAGYTFFGDRFEKANRGKIRAHGIALRARRLTGDYPVTAATLGWAMETFRKEHPKRSFLFELGLQQQFKNYVYNGERANNATSLYLRLQWNFFLK